MKVTIENAELVIRLPLGQPKQSASGRMIVVASTHGNVLTDATLKVGGKDEQIIVGVRACVRRNAYIHT